MPPLLAILVAVLILLVGLLSIPVEIAFRVRRRRSWRGRIRIRWLFGLVKVRLPKTQVKPADTPAPEAGHRRWSWPRVLSPGNLWRFGHETSDKVRRRRGDAGRIWATLRTPGLLPRVFHLLARVVETAEPRHLGVWARLGLDDPADTGQAMGVVIPASMLLPSCHSVRVRIQPDFMGPRLSLMGLGEIRIIPGRVIFALFVFLLSPIPWRALSAWRSHS